jgi:membrane-associated protease RseP (regulator of RpoE activity)
MSRSVVALLVLFFMVASCVAVKPVLSFADGSAENTWVSEASMQVARSSLGVAVVNGKIYAIGGNTREKSGQQTSGGIVGTNEEYDPATDTWIFKASIPTPRENFAIAVYQNKIYCIGGITSSGVTGVNEVYDPSTDTWETKESIPTVRAGPQANVVDGKIYFIGGFVGDVIPGYSYLNLNDVYDPETDSWTTNTPMPTAVSGRLSAVVDDKIYVLMPNPNLNQIYDTETDSWSLEGAPLPSFSMVYASACATTGVNAPKRIYIVGDGGTLVYDPINDCWTDGAVMPTDREGFGVAVVNDILYAIGGCNSSYQDYPDDWIYGPSVTMRNTNERYTPFGYGTVPPEVHVVSPENRTYAAGNVSLAFTVNKPASWVGYSLDGQDNVTITGNMTLSGLTGGLHNITVYARDAFENMGFSETINFTIAVPEPEPEPFPIAPLAVTASAATIAVAVAVLLVYFMKRKR